MLNHSFKKNTYENIKLQIRPIHPPPFVATSTLQETITYPTEREQENPQLENALGPGMLLVDEILHHLTCMKPYKLWDKLPTSTGAGFFPSTVWLDNMLVPRRTSWTSCCLVIHSSYSPSEAASFEKLAGALKKPRLQGLMFKRPLSKGTQSQ